MFPTVEEPTRQGNTLDLILISSPTLVNSVKVVPGIFDHNCPVADKDMLPPRRYQPKKKVLMYKKADWKALQNSWNMWQITYVASHPVHQSMTCGNSSRAELKEVFKYSSPTRCSNRNKTCHGLLAVSVNSSIREIGYQASDQAQETEHSGPFPALRQNCSI